MLEITGKRFQPPFVYHAHPPKDDEDKPSRTRSGGGGAGIKLFKSQAEIKTLFGGLPHTFRAGTIEFSPINYQGVRKFKSKGSLSGFFVVKPQKLGFDLDSKTETTKTELRTNRIGNAFFSKLDLKDTTYQPFIFPEQVAYTANVYDEDLKAKEKKVFIVSRYIPSTPNPYHFNSWGPRLRAWSAPLFCVFGLGDSDVTNILSSNESSYPKALGFYEPITELDDMTAHVFIDTGIIFDKARDFTLQKARLDINTGYVPWIDRKGNNDLNHYLKEFEVWRERINDETFLKEYFEICNQVGIDRKSAEEFLDKVIKPNIKKYERNIDVLCSAGNDQIPQCVLKDLRGLKLLGDSELAVTEKIPLTKETFISRKDHPSFILDLNDGMLVSVTKDTGTRIRARNLFPKQEEKETVEEAIINEGDPLVIGSKYFGQGSSIGKAHIMLTNMGDQVHIRDLQEIPEEGKPTYILISKKS